MVISPRGPLDRAKRFSAPAAQVARGFGSQILWFQNAIYALGDDHNWWLWTGIFGRSLDPMIKLRSARNMGDQDWMLWNHTPPLPSRSAREEVLGFVYVKDVRVMNGVLRPLDETRWEVVCKVNGELYKAEVVSSRELAEQRLVQKNALEATGWVESSGSS
jgi:hypothetical protein